MSLVEAVRRRWYRFRGYAIPAGWADPGVDDAHLAEHVVVPAPLQLPTGVRPGDQIKGRLWVGYDTGRDGEPVVVRSVGGAVSVTPFWDPVCPASGDEHMFRVAGEAFAGPSPAVFECRCGQRLPVELRDLAAGDTEGTSVTDQDDKPVPLMDPEGAAVMTMHVIADGDGPMRTACCDRLIERLPAVEGVTRNPDLCSCPKATP